MVAGRYNGPPSPVFVTIGPQENGLVPKFIPSGLHRSHVGPLSCSFVQKNLKQFLMIEDITSYVYSYFV